MESNKKDVKFILPLSLLGGRENIVKVNNCATRLRLEVKDTSKVNIDEIKKYYPAVQKISDTEIHIVVGTDASELAESLKRIIAFDYDPSSMAMTLIPLLGGRENIVKVNNCATRVRLEVVNADKVNEEKYYPVIQKISVTEVHVLVGTKASEVANELSKILNISDNNTNTNYSYRAWLLFPMLGGIENVVKINNCATRLRLELKDVNKVNIEEIKKYYPAVQKISDTELHIVIGTDASLFADAFRNIFESHKLKTALILPLVGGIDNITKVNNCATRLRLEIKDINKVDVESIKKYYPAVEKIDDKELHIVVGIDANELANEFKKFVI
ncbi:PTS transporter subunit EIIB [Brachyspira hyodysenteriae]|uniref:Phosphoenolpyruvate-dependent sugar phosphotransferase system n=2 Tax=Brachyspira hyodysenteriae TaxID=159 RepID=A0A3B6VAT2_BRAHW|nr:PTS transporter subunit EIIB [Brachyspira hyodysenteriae]ACN82773.1 phosphoenolpyruvate-dependent sugar phosphotransferase system [Brachyspira hyodysenteriae WA1]ANN62602.1 PTS sugar transporter [Brachyspira hyodysenteriae ATCC 27164]AUJ48523.1 PTS sugar transporter [Brachyspira hyodysenteriae]KLI15375.1 PTS sugar transporter [Brachyspira hyodysenteriae]KLI17509.1 PTS sugar transporter [Brachyspira hyodysenteriae]